MKYEVTINGKPCRETGGELVDEAAMKVAVVDIALSLVAGDPAHKIVVLKGNPVRHETNWFIYHHGSMDFIDVVWRQS